jgi:integration host factor subunit alpha
MALTKADIVNQICKRNQISNSDAVDVVEATFEIIKGPLERGEKVQVKNFGKFFVRAKKERRGRDPQTGAEITIAPRKVVAFAPSFAIKKSVNTARAVND